MEVSIIITPQAQPLQAAQAMQYLAETLHAHFGGAFAENAPFSTVSVYVSETAFNFVTEEPDHHFSESFHWDFAKRTWCGGEADTYLYSDQ